MAQAAPPPKTNAILQQAGYIQASKLCNTLQGSVWRATQKATKKAVVIKITDKQLHANSLTIIDGAQYKISENIKTEKQILKYLTKDAKCPKSIAKYVDFFRSNFNYYLASEWGGHSLFQFCTRAHAYIDEGQITISEWHKLVKKIFLQMLEVVEYVHSMNVCHLDLSLENFLIEDVPINLREVNGAQTVQFDVDRVQIRLIDFGLATKFEHGATFESNKFCGKPNYQSPEVTAKKTFNAKSNDVFCLGVCLFCLCVGGMPWEQSSESDVRFTRIIKGGPLRVLKEWRRDHYVNEDLLEIMELTLRYEADRADLAELRKCSWFR